MMDPFGALLLHPTKSPGPTERSHPRQSNVAEHASNGRRRSTRQSRSRILQRKFRTTWHLLLDKTGCVQGRTHKRAVVAPMAWTQAFGFSPFFFYPSLVLLSVQNGSHVWSKLLIPDRGVRLPFTVQAPSRFLPAPLFDFEQTRYIKGISCIRSRAEGTSHQNSGMGFTWATILLLCAQP